MTKLLMLRGLPASGKSKHANLLIFQGGWKRVNKDELRLMIDAGQWSRDNEKIVLDVEKNLVFRFLRDGFNVVVDDTNFAYEAEWRLIAETCGAEFEIKDFTTPVQECIRRNALRGDKKVPEDAIWGMYRRYVEPYIQRPELIEDAEECYIVDIDGTIARMKDRKPFEWHLVGNDAPIFEVVKLIQCLSKDSRIVYLSGRDSVCREETIKWLADNMLPIGKLFMRPEGDNRKDSIIKKELYEANILGKYNVLGVFDDRDQVVELWRSLGLQCYQCNYGSF